MKKLEYLNNVYFVETKKTKSNSNYNHFVHVYDEDKSLLTGMTIKETDKENSMQIAKQLIKNSIESKDLF